MTQSLSFTVPFPPRPLKRALIGRGGKHMYDPAENKIAKRQVADAYCALNDPPFFHGALACVLTFYMPKPKSKIRKNSTPYPYPDCKPDVDNMIKLVLDGLNNVAFDDDAQVVCISACKMWADSPDQARTQVYIRNLSTKESTVRFIQKWWGRAVGWFTVLDIDYEDDEWDY